MRPIPIFAAGAGPNGPTDGYVHLNPDAPMRADPDLVLVPLIRIHELKAVDGEPTITRFELAGFSQVKDVDPRTHRERLLEDWFTRDGSEG